MLLRAQTDLKRPLPPKNCSRIAPDPARTTPRVDELRTFNASHFDRTFVRQSPLQLSLMLVYSETLDGAGKVTLHWSVDRAKSEIRMAVDSPSEGWVLLAATSRAQSMLFRAINRLASD